MKTYTAHVHVVTQNAFSKLLVLMQPVVKLFFSVSSTRQTGQGISEHLQQQFKVNCQLRGSKLEVN